MTAEDSYSNSCGCIINGFFDCESRFEHSEMYVYHGTMKKFMRYENYIGKTDNKISITATSTFALPSGVNYYWKVILK